MHKANTNYYRVFKHEVIDTVTFVLLKRLSKYILVPYLE